MIDVEREIREALLRHEAEAPAFDPLDVAPAAQRARRRQLANVVGGTLFAIAMIAVLAAGAASILRASDRVPADPDPTPSPTQPSPGPDPASGLTPPAEAAVAVGSGTTEGWPWLLSASEDGLCVALTDRGGSTLRCVPREEWLIGPGGLGNVVDVNARSGPSPAPDVVFYFGRAPSTTTSVDVFLPMGEPTDGQVFPPPPGVSLPMSYYVHTLVGYPYPYVPESVEVYAYDRPQHIISVDELEQDGRFFTLPEGARAPTFTTLSPITSGHSNVGTGRDWEIAVFRHDAIGEVCLGEPGGASVCGPEADPVPSWEQEMIDGCLRFRTDCDMPMHLIGAEGGGSPDGISSFGWGLFRDPVMTVRTQRYILPGGFGSTSERAGWLESEKFEIPGFDTPYRVFVYSCDDCLSGETYGFDANGNRIASDS